MKLTGKTKQDFEKWLSNNYPELFNSFTTGYILFDTLSDSCINALIIEWFDSVEIYVQINVENIDGIFSSYVFNKNDLFSSKENSNSRQEATEKAIEKANQIYNNIK